jgi:uncharacterized protein with PIN domain
VNSATTQSWYVGLEWSDVFLEGNSFGMAVGQPTFITDIDVKGGKNESDYLKGGGYAWEFFYKFQVTDNITVTPAIHYLSAPFTNTQSGGNKLNAMSGLDQNHLQVLIMIAWATSVAQALGPQRASLERCGLLPKKDKCVHQLMHSRCAFCHISSWLYRLVLPIFTGGVVAPISCVRNHSMKLFQQMLVAPAALGLLASGANAAELNINGVSDYAASADQVTSVTQFSDVYPTDWAYQALSNLVEQYGCVAGYPNGTFRGNRAMTRYEAAALLNACLDRITEVTDELRRLLKEFETELAILRGRVDGLEARVGELEATQFSTTTKLKGVTNWVLGAAKYHGKGSSQQAAANGGTSFSYNLALNLETSFTGKDLLYTRLRAGNMDNIYGGNGVGLFAQEYGFNSDNAVDC